MRMRLILVFILLTAGCSLEINDDSQKPEPEDVTVLFIGNSLTFFNSMPWMLDRLAEYGDRNLFVRHQTVGGASLEDHTADPRTLAAIEAQPWDYVILQGSSYYIAFPEYHEYIIGAIRMLKEAILQNHPDTKIIFFMDWAIQGGLIWGGTPYTYSDFQQRIIDGTLVLADSMDFIVAPIGAAWNRVVGERPDINLFDEDRSHPSVYGSYLEACVYFSTIFISGSEEIDLTFGLEEDKALYLRSVASETVLNDLEKWNLENLLRSR